MGFSVVKPYIHILDHHHSDCRALDLAAVVSCVAGHTLLLLAALEHAGLCVASRRVWGVVERFFMYDHGS